VISERRGRRALF